MRDDEMMDGLLRRALAAEVPSLTPAFDAAVLRRVGPRGLAPGGRVVLATYGLSATAATAWLMSDLPPAVVAVGLTIGLAMGVAGSAYARRLASRE